MVKMMVWEEPPREEITAWRNASCSASFAVLALCSLGGPVKSTLTILGITSSFGIKPAGMEI